MSNDRTNQKANKGIHRTTAGYASWRWLAGASSNERNWFLGVMMGRGGYQSWIAHMLNGLQDPNFLLQFERTSDAWERSKLVGMKISELRMSYRALSEDQRAELAKRTETELKTGLELLGRDKKTIRDLIELVDPPEQH